MIENGNMYIEFPDGNMTLFLHKFFPAPKNVIRRLFQKTIALNYAKRVEYTEEILSYLRQSIIDLDMEETQKVRANVYVSRMTQIQELTEPLLRQEETVKNLKDFVKKLPRKEKKSYKLEVDKEKLRLSQMRTKMEGLKTDARYQKKEFERVQRWEKQFKDNIELIEQLTEGWK